MTIFYACIACVRIVVNLILATCIRLLIPKDGCKCILKPQDCYMNTNSISWLVQWLYTFSVAIYGAVALAITEHEDPTVHKWWLFCLIVTVIQGFVIGIGCCLFTLYTHIDFICRA
jgi:hypothetical protein